jgi:hypothetical protein
MGFSLPYLPSHEREGPYTSYPFLINKKTDIQGIFSTSYTSSSLGLSDKSPRVDAYVIVLKNITTIHCQITSENENAVTYLPCTKDWNKFPKSILQIASTQFIVVPCDRRRTRNQVGRLQLPPRLEKNSKSAGLIRGNKDIIVGFIGNHREINKHFKRRGA